MRHGLPGGMKVDKRKLLDTVIYARNIREQIITSSLTIKSTSIGIRWRPAASFRRGLSHSLLRKPWRNAFLQQMSGKIRREAAPGVRIVFAPPVMATSSHFKIDDFHKKSKIHPFLWGERVGVRVKNQEILCPISYLLPLYPLSFSQFFKRLNRYGLGH